MHSMEYDQRAIVGMVRAERDRQRHRLRLRTRDPGKALPKGTAKAILRELCQRLGDDGNEVNVDESTALAALERGRRT